MRLLPYLVLAGALGAAPQVGDTQEAAALVQPPVGNTTATPGARLPVDRPIPPAELEAVVDALVRQTMSTSPIAGASVAIVQDDRVVLEKGFGWADLEGRRPVDARTTLFRIGSITKTLTWIAVMNAIAGGTIDLDDPVNDHLPAELRIPVVASTAAITTIDFEPGAVADLNAVLDTLAPRDGAYQHHERWGDDNGSSHVRAVLLGPSLTAPIIAGELTLGSWQQVMLLEMDTRPCERDIVIQVMGA